MEMLGPKRAEIFKRTHLGMKPEVITKVVSPPMGARPPMSKQYAVDNLMSVGLPKDAHYSTSYGGKMLSKSNTKRRNGSQLGNIENLDFTSADGDAPMSLPRIINSPNLNSVSERNSRKSKHNMGSKSFEP